MKTIICLTITFLSGCGIHSGVVPLSDNTYRIFNQAATGFTSSHGGVRDETFNEARQYCLLMRKEIKVISTDNSPAYAGPGNFPNSEIIFKCVANGQ